MKLMKGMALALWGLGWAIVPARAEEPADTSDTEADAADAPLSRAEVQGMIEKALAERGGDQTFSMKGMDLDIGGGARFYYQHVRGEKTLGASHAGYDVDSVTAGTQTAYGSATNTVTAADTTDNFSTRGTYTQANKPNFIFDKAWLTFTIKFPQDFIVHFRPEFRYGNTINVDEAYTGPKNIADTGIYAYAGLKKPWHRANRLTVAYPLLTTAWDRNEDLGLFSGGSHEIVDDLALVWHADYINGQKLSTSSTIGSSIVLNNSLPILSRTRRGVGEFTDADATAMYGAGFGPHFAFGDDGYVSLIGWAYHGRLSGTDLAFLQAGYPNYTDPAGTLAPTNHKARRGGQIDFSYDFGGVTARLLGQYLWTSDGKLHQSMFFGQPSVTFDVGADYLDSTTVIFRWGRLANFMDSAVDTLPSKFVDRPLTWDRDQTTVAWQLEIVKNWRISLEYTFNYADVGDFAFDTGALTEEAGDPTDNEFMFAIIAQF